MNLAMCTLFWGLKVDAELSTGKPTFNSVKDPMAALRSAWALCVLLMMSNAADVAALTVVSE